MRPTDVVGKSASILDRLKSLPAFTSAESFLTYVSSKDNEVDTHTLINWLLKGRAPVYVPTAEQDGALSWTRIRNMNQLEPSRFGILEPRASLPRAPRTPPDSVVIVPGIAFSVDGWRIGYGGGYFDRFLARFGGPIIGLAFDIQIVSQMDPEPHDVRMDFVVTESCIYRSGAM